MKAYMFPGQGSQARGMGGTLFDEYPELTRQADAVLGYSIQQLCLQDPRDELGQTQFTQPALFVVNALHWHRKRALGGEPDYLLGHSLGEFNALLAAGCFDFETGLLLVRKRGELMSQAASGGMAAILNGSKAEIETVLRENGLTQIDLASYNAPTQIVISGARDEIERAQACFSTGKMMFYPLNTSGAFHSRFMRPAQAEFETFLRQFTFADPRIPVVSNVTARPYEAGAVAANLAAQMSSTVLWSEGVSHLLALDGGTMQFEEVGHGEVLTKMLRSIRQHGATAAVSNPRPQPPAQPLGAEEKVQAWNRSHPVGARVKSTLPGYDELETRTEAVVLFGHRAAVYMKGYNGYFDLDELTPA
jgi:malonyl CoA-acyl carrier protein transacylase